MLAGACRHRSYASLWLNMGAGSLTQTSTFLVERARRQGNCRNLVTFSNVSGVMVNQDLQTAETEIVSGEHFDRMKLYMSKDALTWSHTSPPATSLPPLEGSVELNRVTCRSLPLSTWPCKCRSSFPRYPQNAASSLSRIRAQSPRPAFHLRP